MKRGREQTEAAVAEAGDDDSGSDNSDDEESGSSDSDDSGVEDDDDDNDSDYNGDDVSSDDEEDDEDDEDEEDEKEEETSTKSASRRSSRLSKATTADEPTTTTKRTRTKTTKYSPPVAPPAEKLKPKKQKTDDEFDKLLNNLNAIVAADPRLNTLTDEKKSVHSIKLTRSQTRHRKRAAVSNAILGPPPFVPKTLDDLIRLAKLCRKKLYIDCQLLSPLRPHLIELQNMVGLSGIKDQIAKMIIIRLQKKSLKISSMPHILLYGPPGTGKTTLVNILAKILAALGEAQTANVIMATPENMIGPFLGQTAPKTAAIIESSYGGVLLIDEVTAISDGRNASSGDSYSKTCVDVLNRYLSDHGDKFVCVVAGYKHEIERDFLSINQGLSRRFGHTFSIDGYTAAELADIASRTVAAKGMTFAKNAKFDAEMFTRHVDFGPPLSVNAKGIINGGLFAFNGGSVLLLVDCVLITHAASVFGDVVKNVVKQEHIDIGYNIFKANEKIKAEGKCDESKAANISMYI